MLVKVDSECDVLEMHHIGNYEEFSFMYSIFQCCNENEDCEEAVVERITAKHWKTEDQETDKDDTTEHEGVRVQILVPICLQRNTGRRKIRKLIRMTQLSMKV
jgi:hypothetical protein